ncbi:ATP-binding protein [Pseudoalteromonas sp. CnMc7-15]|uniref:ATP-binding protein n=1 Tax=unclassified Pseudoalteromonas TaxID=194690 RepID=UPI001EF54F73|nr:ATP-binding protein [Pseudoalteromonas sp. CnMc7-15]MCG7566602.1 ATP-binding protein [Pseudoalteromonas sp. CnMc7-15]
MEKVLDEYLKKYPGRRAKRIAKDLELDKTKVNKYLHGEEKYIQDPKFGWHVINHSYVVLELRNTWVTANSFEKSLEKCGCPFRESIKGVLIVFPEECAVMLDAGARILYLANCLALEGKLVELRFCETGKAFSYLDRAGFFIHLRKSIAVTPTKPETSMADVCRGNAASLLELDSINVEDFDESIPDALTSKFVALSRKEFEGAAYNVFSELCNNVVEHSSSELDGIAGLQLYGANSSRPHIQIVISDAGLGIASTLRPALEKSKDLGFDVSNYSDAELIAKAFSDGGLSRLNQTPDDGRGLGLLKSSKGMREHGATLNIRQESMSVTLRLESGSISISKEVSNLPKLPGTHICFDFELD